MINTPSSLELDPALMSSLWHAVYPSPTPLSNRSADFEAPLAEYGVPTQDINWLSMPRNELRDAGIREHSCAPWAGKTTWVGTFASPLSSIDSAISIACALLCSLSTVACTEHILPSS